MMGTRIRTTSFLLLFALACTPPSFAESESSLKKRMLNQLDFIEETFTVKYAPAAWKKGFCGWDLQEQMQKGRKIVQNTSPMTVKKFQNVLRDFFASAKDLHVGISFFSTETATLPFRIYGIDRRYYVAAVLDEVWGIKVGDEILTFDDKPVQDVLDGMRRELYAAPYSPTEERMAELCLTKRARAVGTEVPKGSVMLSWRSFETGGVKRCAIQWTNTQEKIFEIEREARSLAKCCLSAPPPFKAFFSKSMYTPILPCASSSQETHAMALGQKKGFFPRLGKVLWETEEGNPFQAYLFETEKGRILGYLRLAHYLGDNIQFEELVKVIEKFQKESEGLIIDQLNNTGGILMYCYAILSLLTDQPLHLPRWRISLTTEDIAMAHAILQEMSEVTDDVKAKEILGENWFGIPMNKKTAEGIESFANFILQEWKSGRGITEPVHYYGLETIQPHENVRYTKPLLVLINELDFSGGDFFPAILQDNKRATLIGSCTAGAGGVVSVAYYPNRFGIAGFTYTSAIAERHGEKVIENLGVTPDIALTFSPEDFRTNFAPYTRAITAVADALLPEKKELSPKSPLATKKRRK